MGFAALAVLLASLAPLAAQDADQLYANRASLADARKAAAIWQQQLTANASDFIAAWKLARANYWLGGHLETEEARLAAFEAGMDAARKAIESLGGKLHSFYFCFGEYDAILIAEAPDNVTVAAAGLAVSSAGALSKFHTTALMTTDDGIQAMKLAKKSTYKPPK